MMLPVKKKRFSLSVTWILIVRYSTFETWWHTRRNQIWFFREMDESI